MATPTVLLNMPAQPPDRQTGVGRFGIALATKLAQRRKFRYVLRSPHTSDSLPKTLLETGIEIINCTKISNYTTCVILQTLAAPWLFPKSKYDLILNLDPYGTGLGGSRRATVFHDLYFRTIPEKLASRVVLKSRILSEIIIRGSNKIVGISHSTTNDLLRYYPWAKDKLKTIYSDSTLVIEYGQSHRPSENSVVDFPYILIVANATPNKNLSILSEAMLILNASMPQIGLIHVGADENSTFENLFSRKNSHIKFMRLSEIDDATLITLYRNAICLCVPSLYEGFCLPIVEAQKLGCPAIFSNRSASGEVGGEGGLSFDPTDATMLAEGLSRVATDPKFRDELIAKGFVNSNRFSWDIAAQNYENLFSEMLS